ncbi:Protein Wnt-4 [Aphelenchoides besseyi]|nr:Protein Wnt-4 [Aphelenchoides besseyi]
MDFVSVSSTCSTVKLPLTRHRVYVPSPHLHKPNSQSSVMSWSLYSMLLGFLILTGSVRASFRNHVKAPAELSQGCPPELLHSHSFRHFSTLCKTQPALAIVAYEGIQDAMEDCRSRMKFQSWDCTQPGTVIHEPSLLRYGYRETAYLLAMSAAGAAWGVATACAQGWLEECKCLPRSTAQSSNSIADLTDRFDSSMSLMETNTLDTMEDWSWQGCTYGVNYAIATSRKLFTRTGHHRGPLTKLEKHNLKAGRLAVKKTLISQCKCHGVSGSCQQKTCWKKTADLTSITDHITERYYKAKQVANEMTKVRNSDLIYLEPSPQTCTPYTYEIQQRRSLPRVCNWRNETHSMGDCNSLCCGRGFTVRHEPVTYKCDCKFIWCCKLQCNECLQHQWISTCNN